jgi:hypothetical protein
MAYTALNLITDVLLDMGVIADQESPTASQSSGALVKLNDLLESWNIDSSKNYGRTENVIPFVSGQQIYTIGAGGDLNITRPDKITNAFIRQNTGSPVNQSDLPITVFNNSEWEEQPSKFITGTFPYGVWFNMEYPLIEAHVTPIPTGSGYSLVFWSDTIGAELTLATVLSFPNGYKRAIKYALYMELAASYQIAIPQQIPLLYKNAMQVIENNNLQLNELPVRKNGWYDIQNNTIRVV